VWRETLTRAGTGQLQTNDFVSPGGFEICFAATDTSLVKADAEYPIIETNIQIVDFAKY
jgi:hypothetical protein